MLGVWKGFVCLIHVTSLYSLKNLVQRTGQILYHYTDKEVGAQRGWAAQLDKQEGQESNPSLLVLKFTLFDHTRLHWAH